MAGGWPVGDSRAGCSVQGLGVVVGWAPPPRAPASAALHPRGAGAGLSHPPPLPRTIHSAPVPSSQREPVNSNPMSPPPPPHPFPPPPAATSLRGGSWTSTPARCSARRARVPHRERGLAVPWRRRRQAGRQPSGAAGGGGACACALRPAGSCRLPLLPPCAWMPADLPCGHSGNTTLWMPRRK